MKKRLCGVAISLFLVGSAGLSNAASVTVTYTADNAIGAWFVDGVSQSLGPNAGNWRKSDSAPLQLSDGGIHDIIWYAYNYGTPTNIYPETTGTNPAAFLAQITGDVVGGQILSAHGSVWEYAISPAPVQGNSYPFNSWDWTKVDTLFDPNGGTNIWNGNSQTGQKALADIDANAEWIWSHNPEEAVYFRAKFMTTGSPDPVPEPATMLLFGTGLAGLAAARRKKKA